MNADNSKFQICVNLCLSVVPFFLLGCASGPSQVNIELRKQLQAKDAQIASLQRDKAGDEATIRSLQQQRGTLPTLPQDRLNKLFTVHGLSLGRLTGGTDLDPKKPGDEGIKVYVSPTDETGEVIKAAGSFVIELFDLDKTTDNLVGRWTFTTEQARQDWFGRAFLYGYIFTCPWQHGLPQHSQLTLKVTFHDELTQREFNVQKVITVNVEGGANAG